MVVDKEKGSKVIPVGTRGVEITISISFGGIGQCCVEVDGLNDYASVDNIDFADLSSVLFKKSR
jgi:hypothetical protein